MDKKVLRNISYGLYVLTSKESDKNVGCIVNSVIQTTSDPSQILVSVNHDNYTNKVIKETKKFGITILKETSNPKIIGTFGFKTSLDTDKFAEFDYKMVDDIPVLNDSCGYLVCELVDIMETTTHTVFLGKVVSMNDYTTDTPMTYKYYHENLKGTSPKNAPTYQEEVKEEKTKTKKYKCKVCGYVYEGEALPEGFVCPICGVSEDFFELVEE